MDIVDYSRKLLTKEEGERWQVRAIKQESKAKHILSVWDLCMEHTVVMCEECVKCGNWGKDYFSGRVLFVFSLYFI